MEYLEHDAECVQVVLIIVDQEYGVLAITLLNQGLLKLVIAQLRKCWVELRRVWGGWPEK